MIPGREALTAAVSSNLKQLRRRCGLSQGELAEKVGLTRQTVQAFETGRRPMSWQTCVTLVACFSLYESGRRLLAGCGAAMADVARTMREQ